MVVPTQFSILFTPIRNLHLDPQQFVQQSIKCSFLPYSHFGPRWHCLIFIQEQALISILTSYFPKQDIQSAFTRK